MYHVYIIYNATHDKFYIGQTHNLKQRITEHCSGLARYTSKYKGGWQLQYTEQYSSRAEAKQRERFLKKQKSKNFYRALIGKSPNG